MIVAREFVAHAFAPLTGPDATVAWEQLRAVWSAIVGSADGGEPVPGTVAELPASPPAGELVAGMQWIGPAAVTQVLVRRSDDVATLSLVFGVPPGAGPDAGPAWEEAGYVWRETVPAGALLGQAVVHVATVEAGDGDLLEPVRASLPTLLARLELPAYGATLADLGSRPGGPREVVAVAPAARAAELSALTWSDGGTGRSPLTMYLEHAARLRYQESLLRRWHRDREPGHPAGPVSPEADVAALRALDEELAEEALRLAGLRADLEALRRTCRIARANLAAALDGAVLPADGQLADWAGAQVEDDLDYLRIDQERVAAAQAAVRSRLAREATPPPRARPDVANRVFVVHGRDLPLRDRFYELLRDLGLHPLEWEELVAGADAGPSPYIGEVVARAPLLAQASVVLMSPDDVVQLHADLAGPRDQAHETARGLQPRPNVIFELGQARMAYPERTFVVEVGRLRAIGDMLGVNVVRFDGEPRSLEKVAARLRLIGCTVDDAGLGYWLAENRFADLSALRRSP